MNTVRRPNLSDAEMMSETDDEARQGRSRQLNLPAITWIVAKDRRAGTLGVAASISGKFKGIPARITRTEDAWTLLAKNVEETIATEDLLKLIADGVFFPLTVEVLPDLAPSLFDGAVRAAESSLNHLLKARSQLDEVAGAQNEGGWLVTFVLASHDLDMTLQTAVSSVMLAVASVEAQLNKWADSHGGWNAEEDRLPIGEKLKALATRAGTVIDLGSAPYQRLCEAVRRRNEYVHSSPLPRPMSLTGGKIAVPGTTVATEAREACMGARQALISLAQALNQPPPRYLSICPPANPPTEEAWSGAAVLNGVREDPDFIDRPGPPS